MVFAKSLEAQSVGLWIPCSRQGRSQDYNESVQWAKSIVCLYRENLHVFLGCDRDEHEAHELWCNELHGLGDLWVQETDLMLYSRNPRVSDDYRSLRDRVMPVVRGNCTKKGSDLCQWGMILGTGIGAL